MTEQHKPEGPLATAIALMVGGAASNQVGAAFGARAFPALGPAGVVAVRQIVAAIVLCAAARPKFWRYTAHQLKPIFLLALVFATMNLSLYMAIEHIGLGLAVTLEFLGPLGVALAGSHTRHDFFTAIAVGIGVYVLVLPDANSDWVGIGLGLTAAACWASYILTNRVVGTRVPGIEGVATSTLISSMLYTPVLVHLGMQGLLTGTPLMSAIAAGVMASAIPYAFDMLALRRVDSRFFGVFMSAHPVMAALAGLVILQQRLSLHEVIGMSVVVIANAITVAKARN